MSSVNSHLTLLDRIVHVACIIDCDLWNRRRVTCLSVFFKIRENVGHTVRKWIPHLHGTLRPTRQTVAMHSLVLERPRYRTSQYGDMVPGLLLRAYLCGTCCMPMTSLVIALVPSRLQAGPQSGCWLFDVFVCFFCYCFLPLLLLFCVFGCCSAGLGTCSAWGLWTMDLCMISTHVTHVSLGGGILVGRSPTLFRSPLLLQ